MSETARVQIGQPESPQRGWTHLLPIVDLLLAHGNTLARVDPDDGCPFWENKSGYQCTFSKPLDMDLINRHFILPELTGYDPEDDSIFDQKNWMIIYGQWPGLLERNREAANRAARGHS